MCVQYIGGYSLYWGTFSTLGVLSTSEGTHECIREGDIMNTLEDVQYIGGYHDASGGIP